MACATDMIEQRQLGQLSRQMENGWAVAVGNWGGCGPGRSPLDACLVVPELPLP